MIRRIASWLAVAVLVWSVPTRLLGWGRDGHAITAALAEAHLSEGARVGIKALLKDQSLASIASWADEVRPQRDETYNWHFVEFPRARHSTSNETVTAPMIITRERKQITTTVWLTGLECSSRY
jgi:hypothetical protein